MAPRKPATVASAMRLWPQAWPMPGRASYSQQIPIVLRPRTTAALVRAEAEGRRLLAASERQLERAG